MNKRQLKEIFNVAFQGAVRYKRIIELNKEYCIIEGINYQTTVSNSRYDFKLQSITVLNGEIVYTAYIKDLKNLVKFNDNFKDIVLD